MEVGPSLWEGALSSRPWKDPPTQVHPGQVILEEQSEEASQRWASKRRAGVDCLAGRAARVLQAEVAVPSADLNFTGP